MPVLSDSNNKFLEKKVSDGLIVTIDTERNSRLYASESICSRLLAHKATNEIKTETVKNTFLLYTKIGNAVEDVIVTAFKNSKIYIGNDLKLPEIDYISLGGKIDAIVDVNGKAQIIEIKTTSNPMKLNLKHYNQALTYSTYLGLDFNILYLDRKVAVFNRGEQNLSVNSFYFQYNEKKSIQNLKNLFKARYYIENNALPEVELDSKHCREIYCDFYDYCHSNKKFPTHLRKIQKVKLLEYQTKEQEFIDNFLNTKEQRIERFLDGVKKIKGKTVYANLKKYF